MFAFCVPKEKMATSNSLLRKVSSAKSGPTIFSPLASIVNTTCCNNNTTTTAKRTNKELTIQRHYPPTCVSTLKFPAPPNPTMGDTSFLYRTFVSNDHLWLSGDLNFV